MEVDKDKIIKKAKNEYGEMCRILGVAMIAQKLNLEFRINGAGDKCYETARRILVLEKLGFLDGAVVNGFALTTLGRRHVMEFEGSRALLLQDDLSRIRKAFNNHKEEETMGRLAILICDEGHGLADIK